MALAAQAGNDNTVVQGSTAHSNNCGGYKQQVAIELLNPSAFITSSKLVLFAS
jgi:hypothetical protein